jgi:hypothetical protein
LEEEVLYGMLVYMLKEKENLDETLMTWKKMEQIVISKF